MKNLFSILIVSILIHLTSEAQRNRWREDYPEKPVNYVTDLEHILSDREASALNAKLRAFEDSTSNQIFIYLAKNLNGENLEDYSQTIFNQWGIGQKDKNNGVLIAIFINDRKFRIQVGYGLEKALPSDLTLQIQDEEMGPHFKERDYYEGVDAGIDKLIYYTRHEYTPPGPFDYLIVPAIAAYCISFLFFIINVLSIRKWKNQPKRRKKNMIALIIFMLIPALGTIVLIGLCLVINDKSESQYVNETDDAYERRMRYDRDKSSSSSSDSSDSFDGGGGGSSGSGGSSSSW
ncbi:MAG TPA: TPM domain-containing protein [Cyclobacteriaceae bacterium]|nr:TPM domain-containing protein [Cyclobacteriaceae bacterium]